MTTIDTASLTPQTFLTAAEKVGLTLTPGLYVTLGADGKPVGCCPLGALAIEARPELLRLQHPIWLTVVDLVGSHFGCGVATGFDGDTPGSREMESGDFVRGYWLGRATRLAAGIDDTGATP